MSAPHRYRKRPVEVEAMQWDGTAESATPILDWLHSHDARVGYVCKTEPCSGNDGCHSIVIGTLEGDMEASAGDWIIRGIAGEFYPCKSNVFTASYVTSAHLSTTAYVRVKAVPEDAEVDGPVIGTVYIETNDADAVRDAIAEALRP